MEVNYKILRLSSIFHQRQEHMATTAHPLPRFQLPARIRIGSSAPQGVPMKQELTDRIARLPGVKMIHRSSDTPQSQAYAYLCEQPMRRALGNPRSVLLCRIGSDGIAIHGLDNWARHQVVMRGWGKLLDTRVVLYLPRDHREAETCWSIILQAHTALTDPSANVARRASASAGRMPSFSRTTLQ